MGEAALPPRLLQMQRGRVEFQPKQRPTLPINLAALCDSLSAIQFVSPAMASVAAFAQRKYLRRNLYRIRTRIVTVGSYSKGCAIFPWALKRCSLVTWQRLQRPEYRS